MESKMGKVELLKVCPFCGGIPNIIKNSSFGSVIYFVKCSCCNIVMPGGMTIDVKHDITWSKKNVTDKDAILKVVNKWNNRV